MPLEYNSPEAIQYLKGLMKPNETPDFCSPLEKYVMQDMRELYIQIRQLNTNLGIDDAEKVLKLENLYGALESFTKVLIFCENIRRSS